MDVCNGLEVEVYDFYVTFNLLTQVARAFLATKTTRQLTYCMAEKIDKMTRDLIHLNCRTLKLIFVTSSIAACQCYGSVFFTSRLV